MGTMAGIALRLREIGQGRLTAVNLNERNTDLLRNLGLDQIFDIQSVGTKEAQVVADQPLQNGPAGKEEKARTMLEAHEALVEADQANETKFKDVLDYLKQDLHISE